MVPADEPTDEIVPDPSDALEFQAIERTKPKRRGLWVFLLLLVMGGGAGAGWHFYGDMLMKKEGDELPVIRAAEGPVKVRPTSPGGMAIPDRDKLVYDRMKGEVEEPRIERLLPPPEMPKTPPAPVAGAEPAPETVAKVEEKAKEAVETAKAVTEEEKPKELPKPQKLTPTKLEPAKVEEAVKEVSKKAEPSVVVNQDMMPKEPAAKPAAQPAAPTTISSLAYQIQIAAVRSEDKATSEWERLKKKHGDLLGGYTLNVVRADLGADKGIFYRLRAGPIASEDVAKALCGNLAKRKVGCLIVRPGN